MIESATLAGIELYSLNNLVDPIHCNNLLDILLFQETILCYLEFLIVLYISSDSRASCQADAIEAATESLIEANEEVCAVAELEFFPLIYLLLKVVTWSLFVILSLL